MPDSLTATSASIAVTLAQTSKETSQEEILTMYRRCACKTGSIAGKLPGRACPRCWEQGWTKCCVTCFGLGTLHKQTREGAQPRTERCGKCMGTGWIPCPKFEIPAAEQEEKAVLAGVGEIAEEDGLAGDLAPTRKRKHKE